LILKRFAVQFFGLQMETMYRITQEKILNFLNSRSLETVPSQSHFHFRKT